MPRRGSPYAAHYQRARAALLGLRCRWCGYLGSDSADHVPPLYLHRHVEGSGCCHLEPAHLRCNIVHSGGWRAANRVRRARRRGVAVRAAPAPSRQW